MIQTNNQTERDVFHEAFCAMMKMLLPDEAVRHMDTLFYGYQLGRESVLKTEVPISTMAEQEASMLMNDKL